MGGCLKKETARTISAEKDIDIIAFITLSVGSIAEPFKVRVCLGVMVRCWGRAISVGIKQCNDL